MLRSFSKLNLSKNILNLNTFNATNKITTNSIIKLNLNLNFKNTFYNTVSKSVSGNPQSKINRENRVLDKLEKFWDDVDKEQKSKADLLKEIEQKYDPGHILIGKHIDTLTNLTKQDPINPNITLQIPLDQSVEDNINEVYFIPLTQSDSNLLKNFNKSTAEKIISGGRMVLLKEITNYNRSQPIDKNLILNPSLDPLTSEEINELIHEFPEIYENEKLFNFVLQNGKKCFLELKNILQTKTNTYITHLKKINYIDHYGEAMVNIPFNTKIGIEFQKYEDPQYINLYLSSTKFYENENENKNKNENEVTNLFKKIYFNFYNEISETLKLYKENKQNKEYKLPLDQGINKLFENIEPCLFDRISAYVDYLKLNNLNFEFKEDLSNENKTQEKFYIFEKLFFKGVELNRYANDEPDDYVLIDSHEDLGIRYYLHKYLTGDSNKFHAKKNPLISSSDFNNEDFHNSYSHDVKERNRKIILRMYLFCKHNYKLKISKEGNENNNLLEYPHNYTGNHLAVFENEIEAPHHTYLINNNFENWLLKHKLDNKKWKLVDVDNFMKGNPFFIKKTSFEENFGKILNDHKNLMKNFEESFPEVKNLENFSYKDEKVGKKGDNKSEGKSEGKNEKNKKEKKEKNSEKKNEEISGANLNLNLINSLEFDYRVSKIGRPFDDTPEDERKLLNELEIERKKMQDVEIGKYKSALEKDEKRGEEFKREIEGDLDSHHKLERLAKLVSKDKQEKVIIDIPQPDAFPKIPTYKVKEKIFEPVQGKNEFESIMNKIIAKRLTKYKKGEEL